ncbi:unnamed protein product [Polarella glacialis]|nr:unnamed protein product [Polarella glacialis]
MFPRMAPVSPTPSSNRDRQNEGSCPARRLGTWKVSDTGDVLTPRPSIFKACSKLVFGSEGSKLVLGNVVSKLASGSEGSKLALGSEGSKLALESEEGPERLLKQTDVPLPQHQSRRLCTQTNLATLMGRNLLSPVSSQGEGAHEVSCSSWTALSFKSSEAREQLPARGSVSRSPSPRGPPQLPAAATSRLLSKDPLQPATPMRRLEVPARRRSVGRNGFAVSSGDLEVQKSVSDMEVPARRRSVGRNGFAVSSGDLEVQKSVSEMGARRREKNELSRRRSLELDDEFEVVLDDFAQKAGVEAATGSAEAARRAGLKLMDRQEALGKNASMEAGEEYRRQLVNAQERSEQQNADPSSEEKWEYRSRLLPNRRASMADVTRAEVKVGERLQSMNSMLDRLSHADGVSSCPL